MTASAASREKIFALAQPHYYYRYVHRYVFGEKKNKAAQQKICLEIKKRIPNSENQGAREKKQPYNVGFSKIFKNINDGISPVTSHMRQIELK